MYYTISLGRVAAVARAMYTPYLYIPNIVYRERERKREREKLRAER